MSPCRSRFTERARSCRRTRAPCIAPLVLSLLVSGATAETIDPSGTDDQYAWAENLGWVNLEPGGDGAFGVVVSDFELTGWMWSENAGWVSLSCKNTSSCDGVDYGVHNDGAGILTGFAFGENLGWIRFDPSTSSGVTIDPATGEFAGEAWSENGGWISFRSDGANPFRIVTSWRCDPAPGPPADRPDLVVRREGDDVVLAWTVATSTPGVDVIAGDLDVLRSSDGDFSTATTDCLSNDDPDDSYRALGRASASGSEWYLARAVNCGGSATFDTNGLSQIGSRDAEIALAAGSCP